MSFYSDLQETAQALIEEFGQAVTLIVETVSTVDPITGGTSAATTEYAIYGAVFDKNMMSSGSAYRAETLIEGENRICLLSTTAVVPAIGNRLVIGGVRYSIMTVKTVNPSGVDVLYEVEIR